MTGTVLILDAPVCHREVHIKRDHAIIEGVRIQDGFPFNRVDFLIGAQLARPLYRTPNRRASLYRCD